MTAQKYGEKGKECVVGVSGENVREYYFCGRKQTKLQ
jgi:hypothetical protein